MLLSILCAGCSINLENVPFKYTLNDRHGVVVLSITSSGECGYALFVDIRNLNTLQEHTLGLQSFREGQDWTRKEKDCSPDNEDYSGRLAVISLPPGQYGIVRFSGMHRYRVFQSGDMLSLNFTVDSRSVTYIGSAHFVVAEDKYNFIISDKRERDLSLFKKKYPHLTEEFIIDLLESVTYQAT